MLEVRLLLGRVITRREYRDFYVLLSNVLCLEQGVVININAHTIKIRQGVYLQLCIFLYALYLKIFTLKIFEELIITPS